MTMPTSDFTILVAKDSAGNLAGVAFDSPLPVTGNLTSSGNLTLNGSAVSLSNPLPANLHQVGGTNITLGLKAASASLPVIGNLTQAGNEVNATAPLAGDLRQVGGSAITLRGGANGSLPVSEGTYRIGVAAGGTLTLNGSTRIDSIWLCPTQNPPGNCNLSTTSGPNHTLIGGNLSEISARPAPGHGPLANVSHTMTLALGANVSAVVYASGGNASAAT